MIKTLSFLLLINFIFGLIQNHFFFHFASVYGSKQVQTVLSLYLRMTLLQLGFCYFCLLSIVCLAFSLSMNLILFIYCDVEYMHRTI